MNIPEIVIGMRRILKGLALTDQGAKPRNKRKEKSAPEGAAARYARDSRPSRRVGSPEG